MEASSPPHASISSRKKKTKKALFSCLNPIALGRQIPNDNKPITITITITTMVCSQYIGGFFVLLERKNKNS
jgi:hypothetical protein